MIFRATFKTSLKDLLHSDIERGALAVSRGMERVGGGLKQALRAQVRSAGLGNRLANTWRSEVYPKGQPSMGGAALVYSKSIKLHRVFSEGAVIRSKEGFFLAIPTENAPKRVGNKKITPSNFPEASRGKLRFVYRRSGLSLLVVDNQRASYKKNGEFRGFRSASTTAQRTGRGLTTVVMFILVPQVRLKKRFDIDGPAARFHDLVPAYIVKEWNALEK